MKNDVYDSPEFDVVRPCAGMNTNICVAEGCFDNACVRLVYEEES